MMRSAPPDEWGSASHCQRSGLAFGTRCRLVFAEGRAWECAQAVPNSADEMHHGVVGLLGE